MTKKRKQYNRRKNFVVIPFNTKITLSTLADNALVNATLMGANFGEDIYVISIDATWTIRSLTSNEVPIFVGIAHGDLSASEILESLDAELTDPDDIIAKEQGRRPVRRVGGFADGSSGSQFLNHGNLIRTTMKMSIGNDHNIDVWAVNRTGSILTTGAIIDIAGVLYGRWQR